MSKLVWSVNVWTHDFVAENKKIQIINLLADEKKLTSVKITKKTIFYQEFSVISGILYTFNSCEAILHNF